MGPEGMYCVKHRVSWVYMPPVMDKELADEFQGLLDGLLDDIDEGNNEGYGHEFVGVGNYLVVIFTKWEPCDGQVREGSDSESRGD